MKKNLISIVLSGVTVCALAFAFTLSAPQNYVHAESNASTSGKLTVNGQASIKVKPDIAYLSAGVQIEDVDAKKAQEKATTEMNKIIESLKGLGIAEVDLVTTGFNLYPRYDYSKESSGQVVGYTASNTVTATIRDISKVGDTIDKVSEVGANVINNIRFSIADSTKIYQQALASAVNNAKSKAEALSNALGVKTGNPVEITELGGNAYPEAYVSKEMAVARDSVAGTGSIQSGELEISASIQAVFNY